MRIRLKGLNSITKKLADGTRRTYWYAWKSGPPLRGEPGTPEFIASYNEAAARKTAAPQGALLSVLQSYQVSGDFLGLAPRTRAEGNRERIRQLSTVGAYRPPRARHLHGMARQARPEI